MGYLEPKKARRQKLVDDFFDNQATYWRDTYREKDLYGIIYQRRQATALSYIDGLHLQKNSRVLEIGCGAGFLAVALAKRGFFVEALDHSEVMVNLTTQHAKQECVENRIRARKGEIHELLYKNESFDLIVAIGVIPWLHDLPKALMEIARTVCSNGYVVLTIDNAIRLTTLLDPLTFPVFIMIKNWGRHKLQRARTAALKTEVSVPSYNQHSPIKFDAFLHKSGLIKIKSGSIGFGPFTFMSHPLFSEKVGIKINSMLQDYANSGNPVLRLTGSHYIILARKYVRD